MLPLPNTPSWHGAQLKHRDFTFKIVVYFYPLIFDERVSSAMISLCSFHDAS
jgi:hypothetical protein